MHKIRARENNRPLAQSSRQARIRPEIRAKRGIGRGQKSHLNKPVGQAKSIEDIVSFPIWVEGFT